MMSFKKLFGRGGVGSSSTDSYKPPERDEHMVVCDTLLSEVDFHIKELERFKRDQEMENRRVQSGVDYSWLVDSNPKCYEIPQMERLELEELCYKVTGPECTPIISLFRDAMSRDPRVEDLPYIMRSCVKKILDERPAPETLSEWVAKRTPKLSSFQLRPPAKIVPVTLSSEAEDIEMQNNEESRQGRETRAFSMPNFTITSEGGAFPL